MKHTYNITGMTCGGCKASVEKYLGDINNVTNVSVNLEKAEAEITMDSHISTDVLKKALPEKYTLSEKKTTEKTIPDVAFEGQEKSKLQQLKPLLIIIF